MNTPILATKLYIPPPRPAAVLRSYLLSWLDEDLCHGPSFSRKLTLISAPAGFGKTTLISAWIAGCERPAAWVSLDEGDSDPTRFLTYLVAALQTIVPAVGEAVWGALQSPNPPPFEMLLITLINDLTVIPDTLVLVLDDYHVIDCSQVDDALAFLIEHLPPQIHLVITTRENPRLPLARLRARNHLAELRASDLRFTFDETAEFLNQVMGLSLSADNIAALETRTEGWIAGLQLAALALQGTLSMQGSQDTATFIESFTGSHRFVMDYLVEEVLRQQPEEVQKFLLHTSILDRLCGPLCDAVLLDEAGSGQVTLEYLEQANLFLVPLDDERRWYRYHHLFVRVLQAYAANEQPDQASIWHQRASEWYDQHGLPSEAIRHALVARDFEHAAALVELAWPAIFKGFHPATWLDWAKALPEDMVRARPVLSAGCAWTLLDEGKLEAAEKYLHDAERWVEVTTEPSETTASGATRAEMVVVNDAEFQTLSANLASARAYLSQSLGDAQATEKHAQRALNLLPEEYHYWRGITAMFLGMANWTTGDLDEAYRSTANSVASLHRAGNIHFQIVGTVILADIRMGQGRLHEAERTYEQALQLARSQLGATVSPGTVQNDPFEQGTVDLYVGLSAIYLERGELQVAAQYLLRGKSVSKQDMSPGSTYRLTAAMARIKHVQGDLNGALDLLTEAENLWERSYVPDLHPAAALKVRVWIEQDQLTEARRWVRGRGLSFDDVLSFLLEFEHITLARVLIAEYTNDRVEPAIHEAMELLERLLQAAEAGGRTGSIVEILVLQALAHHAHGNFSSALVLLERALVMAEPEGFLSIFVSEGQPMQTLLAESLRGASNAAHITRLLTAINQQLGDENVVPDPNQILIEPLSNREFDVLRLLAHGHTNQVIADDLFIALSTVKKHTNNIFGKLGVASRTQAVNRARELNLL